MSFSSSFRASRSYSARSQSLLSRILNFFFCSSVRSVYWITGTSFSLALFAPSNLPCHARITRFSSTWIGVLNPTSLMLLAIFFICSSLWILLLFSYGISCSILTYCICCCTVIVISYWIKCLLYIFLRFFLCDGWNVFDFQSFSFSSMRSGMYSSRKISVGDRLAGFDIRLFTCSSISLILSSQYFSFSTAK